MAKTFKQLTEELYLEEGKYAVNYIAVDTKTNKIVGAADTEKWANATASLSSAYADRPIKWKVVKVKKPFKTNDYADVLDKNVSDYEDHL